MKQSKQKTALRAVKMSLQIKSGLSKAVLILGIPAAFLPALIAKWLQAFTDELLRLQSGGSTVASCLELLLVLVIFFLIQLCMQALRQYTDEEDQVRGTRELKRTLLKCKCEVCYPYIENEDKFQERLEMVNKFAGERTIRSVSMVMNLLTTTITFVSIIVLLWAVNPWIVVLIIFTTFPAAWITYKQNNETFFQNLHWSEKGAMVILYYGLMAEEKHIQELRHYGLYPYLLKRWHVFADSHCKEKRELLTKHTLMNGVADVMRNMVYAAVLLVTAWQIYENPGLGLGLFTMVFSLTGQMQTAASNLFVGTAGFLSTLPYMQEFFYLQDLPKDNGKKETEMIKKGDIQCEHVSFTYSGAERQALSDVSISIQDGEKIAIVGDNGSGKSTFISLLCGMLQPDSGSIKVGGESMEAEPEKIRNSISVVFQDFAHFISGLSLLTFPAPIILALIMNEVRNAAFKKFVQTAVYLPHFLSWAIVASLTFFLLSTEQGLVNKIAEMMGNEPTAYMFSSGWIYVIILVQSVWKGIGWGSIVYLAAISGIDQTLYEAAKMDGASRFQCIWKITLPSIMPTIMVMLILKMGTIISVDFEQVFLMNNAMVKQQLEVFEVYIFNNSIASGSTQYSYSTAIGIFKSVINTGLVILTNWIANRKGYEGVM